MLNKKIRTIIMLALIVVVSSFMNTTHTWAKEQIQFKAGFDWTQFKEGQDYAKGRVIVTFIDNLKEEKEMLQVIEACNFSVSAFSFKEYEGGKLAFVQIPDSATVPEAIREIEKYEIVKYATPDFIAKEENDSINISRLYGDNRYETALKAADRLLVDSGKDRFDTVIIATGEDYADALTSGSLAGCTNAPVLLINKNSETSVIHYISEKTQNNGNIYIVGGTAVVSERVEASLKKEGYIVKRLAGKNRYETNLMVLKECSKKDASTSRGGKTLFVATGHDYPDALAASATKQRILLVDKELSAGQKAYLSSQATDVDKIYVLGGETVVSKGIEQKLEDYSFSVDRIAGQTRIETATFVAKVIKEMYGNRDGKYVYLVNAYNFPDGLVAGAMCQEGSCVLLMNSYKGADENTREYVYSEDSEANIIVMGGPSVISDWALMTLIKSIPAN